AMRTDSIGCVGIAQSAAFMCCPISKRGRSHAVPGRNGCTATARLPGREGRSAQADRACPRTGAATRGYLAAPVAGGRPLFERQYILFVRPTGFARNPVEVSAFTVP